MDSTPLYNLDNIKAIDNAEDFILQVITIFLKTVPANTEALAKACVEKDWEQVYFYAHKIKSNVKLLNISSVIDDVLFVEESAKGRIRLGEIEERVKVIGEVITLVKADMTDKFIL